MNNHLYALLAMVLAGLAPAIAQSTYGDLTLSPPDATHNRFTVTLSGAVSDSKTTNVSGTLGVALDANVTSGATSAFSIRGANLAMQNMSFSGFLWSLNATNLAGTAVTTAPPGAATPTGTGGTFSGALHRVIINQGSLAGTYLGQPVSRTYSPSSPLQGPGTGTGVLTVTPTTLTPYYRFFSMIMTMPVDFTQSEVVSGQTVNVRVQGMMRATGTVALPLVGSGEIAAWNFNSGDTSAARRSANNVPSGATVSTLDFNSSFTFAGTNNVPADVYDGYGFGGNSNDVVVFLARANFSDDSAVPNPRPTVNDYTSWGPGSSAGTGSNLAANGNAPISFTVTANALSTVVVDSVTMDWTGGSAFLTLQFQEAGASPGTPIFVPSGTAQDAKFIIPLAAPVVVGPGQTKTFTINLNSAELDSNHFVDGISLNGRVDQQAPPNFIWSGANSLWTDASPTGWSGGPPVAGNTATINSGLVNFANHDTFGNDGTTTSAGIILNGGTLASNGWFTTIWNINLNGGTLLANGGANSSYPAFQLAGTIQVGGSQPSTINATSAVNSFNQINIGGSGNADLTLNVGDVTSNANSDLVINATLQNNAFGASSLTKTGAGTLSLTAPNTYTGSTTITQGSLKLDGGEDTLPVVTLVTLANAAGATLDLNGLRQELRGLTGGGATGGSVVNSAAGSSVLTLRPSGGDNTTFSGVIDGDIRLEIVGNKTSPAFAAPRQRLAGTANTFIGGILVDGATLLARVDGSLGAVPAVFDSANITLQNNGTLLNEAFNNALTLHANRGITLGTGGGALVAAFDQNITIQGQISGAAGNHISILANGATVIFSGDNTYAGNTLIQGVNANGTGRLSIGNGGTSGSLGSGAVTNDGLLRINRSDTITVANDIAGTGEVVQQGTGTTFLTGNLSYSGTTTVEAGTLGGGGSAASATTVLNSGTLAPGASIGTMSTATLTFQTGSAMQWEINSSASASDRVVANGNVTIGTTTALAISDIAGSPAALAVGSKFAMIKYTGFTLDGTFNSLPEGATLNAGPNTFAIAYADTSDGVNAGNFVTLTVVTPPPTGFAAWAASNGVTGGIGGDDDNDGVANGIEFFIGDDSSGFTAMPVPDASGTITWPMGSEYSGTYGTDFVVVTSTTLAEGSWSPIPVGQVTITPGVSLSYTLPAAAGRIFARLEVSGPN